MQPRARLRGTNPHPLRYTTLDGATLTLALQDAAFNPAATALDFQLLGAPLGVSVARVDIQSNTQATLTLAYTGPVLATRHRFALRLQPGALSGPPLADVALGPLETNRVAIKPHAARWAAPFVALYLLAVGVPALFAFVSQWGDFRALTDNNDATAAAASPNILLGLDWTLGPEELTLVFVASVGVFFACLAGLRAAAAYLGDDEFEDAWWLWYLIRPLIGAGVALGVFWTLRAGILGDSSEPQELNTFGIAAVAALSGLFAHTALDKLKDVVDVLLGEATPRRGG